MIEAQLQEKIENELRGYREFTPIEIAEKLGVEIIYTAIEDTDFSGAIKKEKNKVSLYVNAKDSQNRQLFTIAHELGHLFLHGESLDKGIISYRHSAFFVKYDEAEKKREEQANHFAAEVLMPKRIFVEYYFKNSHLSKEKLISKMASLFGVSEDAVKIRMSYLDL